MSAPRNIRVTTGPHNITASGDVTRHARHIYDPKTKAYVLRHFTLTINAEAVATELADKAWKSKNGKSRILGGAVVLKAVR